MPSKLDSDTFSVPKIAQNRIKIDAQEQLLKKSKINTPPKRNGSFSMSKGLHNGIKLTSRLLRNKIPFCVSKSDRNGLNLGRS